MAADGVAAGRQRRGQLALWDGGEVEQGGGGVTAWTTEGTQRSDDHPVGGAGPLVVADPWGGWAQQVEDRPGLRMDDKISGMGDVALVEGGKVGAEHLDEIVSVWFDGGNRWGRHPSCPTAVRVRSGFTPCRARLDPRMAPARPRARSGVAPRPIVTGDRAVTD